MEVAHRNFSDIEKLTACFCVCYSPCMNHKENNWRHILSEKILPCFPKPWASYGADAKFERYIKNTLHQLDALKSPKSEDKVYLGQPETWFCDRPDLQCYREAAKIPPHGGSIQDVTEGLVKFFHGMLDWGHPKMGVNVVPPSTLPSIAANLMAAVFSPNIIEEDFSVNVAAAEVEAVSMCARLAGYDPLKAGGLFTFGGMGTWLYALKLGLTKALGQESRYEGIRKDAQIFVSEVAHFSKLNCTDWTGLGMNNVRSVRINDDHSMNLEHLRESLEECFASGKPVGLICCTTGTTDAFGVDDVKGIISIRDEFVRKHGLNYIPHVHSDSVIGWAWMAYKDYDFEKNPLGLDDGLKEDIQSTAEKVKFNYLADSIGIDFHKTGYSPYISSMFLLKNGSDFELLKRPVSEEAYLFHFGTYHPGEFSLESSRSANGALAAWANLKLFGLEGFQVILARLVAVERKFREKIDSLDDLIVVNPDDHGFVTLYRVYPPGIDSREIYKKERDGKMDEKLQEYNAYLIQVAREIDRMQREENGPFLSFTSNHRVNKNGKPIAALKIYPMSPFVTEESIDSIMAGILAAKKNVDKRNS